MCSDFVRVSDGTRTRDRLDHNYAYDRRFRAGATFSSVRAPPLPVRARGLGTATGPSSNSETRRRRRRSHLRSALTVRATVRRMEPRALPRLMQMTASEQLDVIA